MRSVWRAARAQRRFPATLWAVVRCWRAEREAPLQALLRLAKEPAFVIAPPPKPGARAAAPARRRRRHACLMAVGARD